MNAPQDFRTMTAETMGRDLLQALIAELRLLPKPWPQLPQDKQDDIIDRLRARVETNVKMAVHILSAQGRVVVVGDLKKVTVEDGAQALIKFGVKADNLLELCAAAGQAVMVVVGNAAEYTGGMGEVKGEADQRGLDFGHEYHNNDGGGMESSFAPESQSPIIDGNMLALPAPVNPSLPKTAKLGELPNDSCVYTCEPDETIRWASGKKHSLEIRLLELETGHWLYATTIQVGTMFSSSPLSFVKRACSSREEALQEVQAALQKYFCTGEGHGLNLKEWRELNQFVSELLRNKQEGMAA